MRVYLHFLYYKYVTTTFTFTELTDYHSLFLVYSMTIVYNVIPTAFSCTYNVLFKFKLKKNIPKHKDIQLHTDYILVIG